MKPVPEIRITVGNDAPPREGGAFVLYWMNAQRRVRWNFALQRAVQWAVELEKPLVVFEALRTGYRWASDRLHQFVLDGMAENARRLRGTKASYYGYVEDREGAGSGLLEALAGRACVVVTDDYPAFFLPRMVAAAARRLPVLLEKVDSNGLLPLRAGERVFPTAYAFRRHLQKVLRPHLAEFPAADPLAKVDLPAPGGLPAEITERWPNSDAALLAGEVSTAGLPIDHSVAPGPLVGGSDAAERVLDTFLEERLDGYAELRNHPDVEATTGLSPYLHFGHMSTHEVFSRLMADEDWDVDRLAPDASGKRSGWWGVGESAEALLDQVVTWRELGFNMCALSDDYESYESLPEWARKTLAEHEKDVRPELYELAEFEEARTHDELWNAAQSQLVLEGRLQNYLRMLWGKKILEWSPTPRDALSVMIELNNKYALDGRDPNSYSGIFWCLGRYDRAWGPERPIFGKIRYMSSENTMRKLRLNEYLARYSP
jgi:deoxyribodipyrimidine photo-lyase